MVREARIDYYSSALSQKALNDGIIDIVIRGLVKETATESLKLNELAKGKAFDLIARSLKNQRGLKAGEKDIKNIGLQLQEKHIEERKRDVHKIHHTLHVVTDKVLPGGNIA